MKAGFHAIIFSFLPTAALACLMPASAPTEEQLKRLPAGYYGFEATIKSVAAEDGLPARDEALPRAYKLIAQAQITQNHGPDVPDLVTLSFGPCSIFPDIETPSLYIAVKDSANGHYDVVDHPDFVLHKFEDKR